MSGVTGWYGKLPARGDFVCHGLSPEWVEPWDACLQQVLRLAAGRGSPLRHFAPWRFLAWPQGTDGPAWAGVLVPSHDRVGRAFPLTVVQRLAPGWAPGQDGLAVEAALAWLADAALDVTDTADPVLMADFVAVLSGLGPVIGPTAGSGEGVDGPWPPGGVSLWWAPPAPGAAPQPLVQPWPPAPAQLLDLLSLATAAPQASFPP